jgi:MSHA biogenesis protein MshK
MSEEKRETGDMRQIAFSLLVVLPCALVQGYARAQPMHDPMRPADLSASSSASAAASTPALQAVITSPGRKLAVIDGNVVPLGASVRGSTLAGVSDSVVVLQKNGSRDVLLMHPDIEKKPSRRERP